MNTNVNDIVDRLKARGFTLRLVDGTVKVAGPEKPDAEKQGLLNELRERKAEVRIMLSESDPVVPFEVWYLVFHELHIKLVHETPDFDYLALKEQSPELYWQIKTKENEIDALRDAKLSEVMSLVRQWHELILRAHFEQRKGNVAKIQAGEL